MWKVEHSVVINRPVEEVFAYVADPEKATEYNGELVESKKTSEGPVGVGTTSTAVVKLLGRRIEATNEITGYEPNRKLVNKVTSGPVSGAEGGYTFESVDGGTRLTFVVEADTSGIFKLADPLVSRMFKRQQETNLANLKDLLEAQG
jgi:uncharacterized protein YndB with AHSA1/START domain